MLPIEMQRINLAGQVRKLALLNCREPRSMRRSEPCKRTCRESSRGFLTSVDFCTGKKTTTITLIAYSKVNQVFSGQKLSALNRSLSYRLKHETNFSPSRVTKDKSLLVLISRVSQLIATSRGKNGRKKKDSR